MAKPKTTTARTTARSKTAGLARAERAVSVSLKRQERALSSAEERARSLLRDAIAAWEAVAQSWRPTAEQEPLGAAMAAALEGLEAAARGRDVDALVEKGGPVRWARSYDPMVARNHPRRSESAARFMVWLGDALDVVEGGGISMTEEQAAAIVRVAWTYLRELVPAPAPDSRLSETEARVTKALLGRARRSAKDVAVVLLHGHGLTKAQARSVVEDA